jgi:hypothetical protein
MAKKIRVNKPMTIKEVVTEKNFVKLAKAGASQNELVWQCAPKMSNQQMIDLMEKAGRKFTVNSLRWYASKARAGLRK